MKKLLAFLLVAVSLTMFLSGCSISGSKDKSVSLDSAKNPDKKDDGWRYSACVRKNGSDKWGYINKEGNFVIEPIYDRVADFQENGLAVVTKKDMDGLIDKTGKVVVEPQYYYISDFSDGFAIASRKDKYAVIDEKGKVLYEASEHINTFKEGMAVFSWKGSDGVSLYGYLDKTGKVSIEPQFKYANDFEGDKALVTTREDKVVLIDKTGKIIRTYNYSNVMGLSEGTVIYRNDVNEKNGYLNEDGTILIEDKYSRAEVFKDGFAVVSSSEDYSNSDAGVINKKGEFVIKPEYSDVYRIGKGLYLAVDKSYPTYYNSIYSRKALVNTEGKRLTDFIFYDFEEFQGDVASVSDETHTYFIDKKGQRVNSLPKLKGIGSMKIQGDLIKAYIDSRLSYVTKDGKVVWEEDTTYKLENSIVVKELKHRPDRCMLIYYPEVLGIDSKEVELSINRELKKIFVGDKSASEKADGLYSEDFTMNFRVTENKDLLLIEKTGYFYPIGAAHGTPSWQNYHINIHNGKFYSLADLFKKNSRYVKKITEIINKQIAKQKESEDYMIFDDKLEAIRPDQNFVITKDSLKIYFDVYEIAAYAAGFPEFDIPYGEIIDIIDTEGEMWKSFEKNVKLEDGKGTGENIGAKAESYYIEEAMNAYETYMPEAINQNNFALVEPYLLKDSSLYKSQTSLVSSLYKQGIKEELVEFSIKDIKQVPGKEEWKVYVNEVIAIKYPEKDYQKKSFKWIYTVVYSLESKKYQLSGIEKWN
ncbi:MAG: WG repeat-containing protein [Clostridia bacterium]|nr:WG repeat-containing protein [Clostridia bacterium]